MSVRTLAVDGYLKLVRMPLDAAAGIAPGVDPEVAGLALDRVDATVRDLAGAVLIDPALRQDAARRRTAADERSRALQLRVEAQQKRERADERLSDQHQQAERRRVSAEAQAKKRKEQAEERRRQKAQQAADSERKRKAASRRAAARVDEQIEDDSREAKLEALDTKADALAERDEALTAKDEAQRLGDAAARAKAERKSARA
jgi:colicin import membrane protein